MLATLFYIVLQQITIKTKPAIQLPTFPWWVRECSTIQSLFLWLLISMIYTKALQFCFWQIMRCLTILFLGKRNNEILYNAIKCCLLTDNPILYKLLWLPYNVKMLG